LERVVLLFKNYKGYSLAETITAFSMWILIVSILIPQLVLLTQERVTTKQSSDALKLLHEKIQHVAFSGVDKENEDIERDSVVYHLTWKEEGADQKACMEWTSLYKKTKSVCLLVS
jgi:competence protein ComGE